MNNCKACKSTEECNGFTSQHGQYQVPSMYICRATEKLVLNTHTSSLGMNVSLFQLPVKAEQISEEKIELSVKSPAGRGVK